MVAEAASQGGRAERGHRSQLQGRIHSLEDFGCSIVAKRSVSISRVKSLN